MYYIGTERFICRSLLKWFLRLMIWRPTVRYWRPRVVTLVFQVWSWTPDSQRKQWCKSQPKGIRRDVLDQVVGKEKNVTLPSDLRFFNHFAEIINPLTQILILWKKKTFAVSNRSNGNLYTFWLTCSNWYRINQQMLDYWHCSVMLFPTMFRWSKCLPALD